MRQNLPNAELLAKNLNCRPIRLQELSAAVEIIVKHFIEIMEPVIVAYELRYEDVYSYIEFVGVKALYQNLAVGCFSLNNELIGALFAEDLHEGQADLHILNQFLMDHPRLAKIFQLITRIKKSNPNYYYSKNFGQAARIVCVGVKQYVNKLETCLLLLNYAVIHSKLFCAYERVISEGASELAKRIFKKMNFTIVQEYFYQDLIDFDGSNPFLRVLRLNQRLGIKNKSFIIVCFKKQLPAILPKLQKAAIAVIKQYAQNSVILTQIMIRCCLQNNPREQTNMFQLFTSVHIQKAFVSIKHCQIQLVMNLQQHRKLRIQKNQAKNVIDNKQINRLVYYEIIQHDKALKRVNFTKKISNSILEIQSSKYMISHYKQQWSLKFAIENFRCKKITPQAVQINVKEIALFYEKMQQQKNVLGF